MSRERLQLSYELSGSDKDASRLPVRCHFKTCQFLIVVTRHLISIYDNLTKDEVVKLHLSSLHCDRLSDLLVHYGEHLHL